MTRTRLILLVLVLALLAGVLLWLTRSPEAPSSDSATAAQDPRPSAPQGVAPLPGGGDPTPVSEPEQPAPDPNAPAKGTELLRAPWGSGRAQLGRREADESNPEAPMSLTVDGKGNLLLLDQVNRRVQRFDKNGNYINELKTKTSTAQDLLVDEQGRTMVLTRLGDTGLELFDAQGKSTGKLPVVGGRVDQGGGISGLFADSDGIYVEVEHDTVVRIATADGATTDMEGTLPGRPTRDGKLLVRAGIIDKGAGRVYVQAHRRDRSLAWETPLNLGRTVLQLLMLDSDSAGNVYLGADVGREAPETHAIVEQATLVVRLSSDGNHNGTLLLPPTTDQPAETFRPLTVSPDGKVYQMRAGPNGVTVTLFTFGP